MPASADAPAGAAEGEAAPRRRRRGRRGGARRRRRTDAAPGEAGAAGAPLEPEGSAADEEATADAGDVQEPVQEAAEALTAPPAAVPPEQIESIQVTPTLAVETRGPGSSAETRRAAAALGSAFTKMPPEQDEATGEVAGDEPAAPQPGATPPAAGGPRPPAGAFMRPGVRPNVGRMTFSKGSGRHVFRPSGFRPPRPAVPPLPQEGGEAGGFVPEGVPSGQEQPPQPMPAAPNAPAPQAAPHGGGQHPMHRGPRPPQHQPQPQAHQPQRQPPRQQQRQPQQPPRQQQGHQRAPQNQPPRPQGQQQGQRPPQQGQHRGAQPAGQHGAPRPPAGPPPVPARGAQAQVQPPSPPQLPPAQPGAPGVAGITGAGHRGPQVIARPPEPPPDTVPLPPVAEGTDLAETAALAPTPTGEATQPPAPADAAALAPFAEDIEIIEAPAPARRREATGRDMIINVVEGEEIRIAIVRKGLLEELYMERSSTESHVGNIYKGRVTNVEPSIQAAFIDFGIGKNGFLHISDLHPQYFRASKEKGPRQPPKRAPQQQASPEAEAPEEVEPADAVAAQSGEPGPEAFVSAYTNGEVESDELLDDYEVEDAGIKPMERVGRKTPRRDRPPIQHCLRRGQEVIVQVTKEGIGTKGPTLTSYISCPGRYLVMMPGMSALGVSRKIEDEDQRRELRKILLDLSPPKNLGFIIRTAGTDVSKRELQGDLNYLVRMWKVIANRIRTHRAPVELYQESDLVIRTIRDVFNDEIDRIIIDNEQVASRVRDFLSIVNPRSAGVVELYTGTLPIFQKYNVEREIEKIHSRRVEMANGGSLVIDSAEALVAIDVNSGRYREMRDAELTAFNMNKEALKEVCRQLRLRDLGGVVVIDFIDMREDKHKREIERLLKEELKNDRAKTKVLRMSQFCMIEMTRQRVRPSLKRSIYMDCPHCHGSALIKTPESVSLDVMRRVAAATVRAEIARIDVRVYPSVATYVLNRKRKALVELEERSAKRINITPDASLAGDAIVIDAFDARASLLNVVL